MTISSASEQVAVGTVMHAGVVTCAPGASLRTVAGMLAAHRIHAVVVRDEAAPGVGRYAVVTDRDVVLAHARGKLDDCTAREAASEPTITVRADLDLRYASELMARNGTTHVVVVNAEGRPVGVVSSLDVATPVRK
jgi:CBS domain-containing protein